MSLKFKLKSREEVPEELVQFYVERDGAFFLDAEGAVDKARVVSNNCGWRARRGRGRRQDACLSIIDAIQTLMPWGARGSERSRTPVAAKMALPMAGAMPMMGVSPAPAE